MVGCVEDQSVDLSPGGQAPCLPRVDYSMQVENAVELLKVQRMKESEDYLSTLGDRRLREGRFEKGVVTNADPIYE